MPVDLQEIQKFLEKCKLGTYADKDAPKAPSTRLKSEDYHIEDGDFIYHDTYFGGRRFIGGEIVYKNEVPIWGDNYYGYVVEDSYTDKDVYAFLRQALMAGYPESFPIRGPENFQNNGWEYKNMPKGKLDQFTGKEEIYHQGKLVYEAFYHGGLVKG